MNRYSLLLLVATSIAGGNAFGQGQSSGRSSNPAVRVAQSPVIPARSSAVPRPARPVGRMVSQPVVLASDEGDMVYEDAPDSMVLGESYDPNEGLAEIGGGCTTCGGGGCESCGDPNINIFGFDLCNPAGMDRRQLCIGLPSHGWVSVEYLNWFQNGMETPALVTTSPANTAQNLAGVLPNATTLYGGDNTILNDRMSGTRVRFGWWFANNPNLGIEGEYLGFAERTASFDRQSNGATILARPFYNAVTGLEDSELVSFPGTVSGRVRTTATSKLDGAAVRFKRLLCCSSGCGFSPLTCGPVPSQSRLDATVGWRFFELKESLGIQEDLTSLRTSAPGSFIINDNFRTRNQFNGAEIGVNWAGRRGYWSLDMLMRLGLGNTRQEVIINGTTQATQNGVTTTSNGGLLAQRTNSGTFTRNQFGVVPELGATLGYQFTQRMRLTAGYSFIYWSNVVRPGDQIDTTVNPNLLPPENPTQTAFLNPRFAFRESDYWVQGLSLGGEYRW